MLLLFIDALILGLVVLASFLIVRAVIRKNKQREINQAIFRQHVAEDLARQVDRLDPEKVREHERKVQDKLNGLH